MNQGTPWMTVQLIYGMSNEYVNALRVAAVACSRTQPGPTINKRGASINVNMSVYAKLSCKVAVSDLPVHIHVT